MDKLRWQTFARACGLCGEQRISMGPMLMWRWCPKCDSGLRSPEPKPVEEPKEAKGE